jgi:TP901 family phage tail tape measure protein
MANIGQLIVTLGVDSKGMYAAKVELMNLQKGMQGAATKAQDLATRMQTMGRKMMNFYSYGYRATMMLTVPLVAAGTAAFKLAKDFDAAMNKIVGLVGIPRKEMEEWKKEILEMAPDVGKSPKELAEALYFVSSAGFKSAQALEITNQAARAAAAGLGETADVAQVITSAMNAYRTSGLTAAQAMDVLVAAVREGKAEAPGFASAIGQVIPIAAELGVSFDQVAGAMASMTLTGASAANAAVYLKGILNILIDPATETESLLRKMGTSANHLRNTLAGQGLMATLQEVRVLTEKWGTSIAGRVFPNIRALIGYLSLTGENLEYNKMVMERVRFSTGDAAKAFEEAGKSIQQRWNVALAKGQVFMIALGNAVSTIILPLFEKLMNLAEKVGIWFRNLGEGTRKLIMWFGLLAAASGPVYLGFAFLLGNILPGIIRGFGYLTRALQRTTVAMKAFNAVSKASVWGLIAAGVAAAGVAIYKAKTKMNDFAKAQQQITGDVGQELIALNYVFDRLRKTTAGTVERKEAIADVNSRYGEYLANLVNEKSSLEQIDKVYKAVTKSMMAKMTFTGYQKALEDQNQKIAQTYTKNMKKFHSIVQTYYSGAATSDFIIDIFKAADEALEKDGGQFVKGSKNIAQAAQVVWEKYIKQISQSFGYAKYNIKDFREEFTKFVETKADASPIIALMNAEIERTRKAAEELDALKQKKADLVYEDPVLQQWRLDIPSEMAEITENAKAMGGAYDDIAAKIDIWTKHLGEGAKRMSELRNSTDYLDKAAMSRITEKMDEFSQSIVDLKFDELERGLNFIEDQSDLMGVSFEKAGAKVEFVQGLLTEFTKGLNTAGGAMNWMGLKGLFLMAVLQTLKTNLFVAQLDQIVEETKKAVTAWENLFDVTGILEYGIESTNAAIDGQRKYLAKLSEQWGASAKEMTDYINAAEKLYQLESSESIQSAQLHLKTVQDQANAVRWLTSSTEVYSALLSEVGNRLEFLSSKMRENTNEYKELATAYRALLIGEEVADRVSNAMGDMFSVLTDESLTGSEKIKKWGEVLKNMIFDIIRDLVVAITKALILQAIMGKMGEKSIAVQSLLGERKGQQPDLGLVSYFMDIFDTMKKNRKKAPKGSDALVSLISGKAENFSEKAFAPMKTISSKKFNPNWEIPEIKPMEFTPTINTSSVDKATESITALNTATGKYNGVLKDLNVTQTTGQDALQQGITVAEKSQIATEGVTAAKAAEKTVTEASKAAEMGMQPVVEGTTAAEAAAIPVKEGVAAAETTQAAAATIKTGAEAAGIPVTKMATSADAASVPAKEASAGASAVEAGASAAAGAAKMPFPLSLLAISASIALVIGSIAMLIKAVKMKKGGTVPEGYPNDTFPALLSSGETVVPKEKLEAMDRAGVPYKEFFDMPEVKQRPMKAPVALAKGGIVPQGYPNDTFPALLTSGETVIPKEKVEAIEKAQISYKEYFDIPPIKERPPKVIALTEKGATSPDISPAWVNSKESTVPKDKLAAIEKAQVPYKEYFDMPPIKEHPTKVAAMKEGGIVPQGYPNDTFPAFLTSGEIVMPEQKVQKFFGEKKPTKSLQDTSIRENTILKLQTGGVIPQGGVSNDVSPALLSSEAVPLPEVVHNKYSNIFKVIDESATNLITNKPTLDVNKPDRKVGSKFFEETFRNTMEHSTDSYNTLKHNTLERNTDLYNTLERNTLKHNTDLYNTNLYNTDSYNNIERSTLKHSADSYNTLKQNTDLSNTIERNALKQNTNLYNTDSYNALERNTLKHNTDLYNTLEHNTDLYNTLEHNTDSYNAFKYNTIEHSSLKKYVQSNYDIPKLQTGGTIPAGYSNDSYPAMLTSGEVVMPNNLVKELLEGFSTMGLMKEGVSKIPKLANGGVVPSGYPKDSFMAMLSSNEAVIPLDRIDPTNTMEGEVRFVIEQDKLVGILAKANKKNNIY